MRRFMRNTGLAALGLAAMATGSLAQENTATEAAATDVANNSVFGDWVMACEAVTVSRNMCRLVQEQSPRETGEMLARFIAVPVADGVILLAQVPMGVYLPGGAVYRFEGQDDVLDYLDTVAQGLDLPLYLALAHQLKRDIEARIRRAREIVSP